MSTDTLVQSIPSIKTVITLGSFPKPVPVIVTVSPPSYQPKLGEISDTVGVLVPEYSTTSVPLSSTPLTITFPSQSKSLEVVCSYL